MDSNGKKKLGVAIIVAVFVIYVAIVVGMILFLEAPTGLTVAYAVILLLFIVLLSYEGWQRIKEIDGGLEDAIDDY